MDDPNVIYSFKNGLNSLEIVAVAPELGEQRYLVVAKHGTYATAVRLEKADINDMVIKLIKQLFDDQMNSSD